MLGVRLARHAGAGGVVDDLLREQADETADRRVVGVHGQVERHDALAEHALADREHVLEVGALLVELGDDDGARHPHRGALLPQQLGRGVDAVHGRHDEQRGVRGAEPGAEIAHEVGVPRRVDEVDLHAVDLERREGQPDGALLAHLGLVEVGHGRALLDAPGAHEGACGHEQLLDERGLPGTGRADQHHVADLVGVVGHRCSARGPCGVLVRHVDRLLLRWIVSLTLHPRPSRGNRFREVRRR